MNAETSQDPANSELTVTEQLQQEMAPISFQELQKFFARGVMIVVDRSLDLVTVAVALHEDNAQQLQQWLDMGLVNRAQDEQAQKWVDERTEFMAVTVAPWVLVQEMK
ncbi:DUF2288 domain-containing protein [Marinicella meishanensis]|uniref:DUF2288 domain-containing protein n=1 Tax=Marinicella meishanensis TaxID=2873263 RepID=UPI001CBD7BFD|nr:DUF2288 domain-containing protein [Marinicella sp. NBU2979]